MGEDWTTATNVTSSTSQNIDFSKVQTYRHDASETPTSEEANGNAKEYFEKIKSSLSTLNEDELSEYIESASMMAEKFKLTGQTEGLIKLNFYLSVAAREKKLAELGFNKFVTRKDIATWSLMQSRKVSKNILFADMRQYTRDIPNDVVQKLRVAAPYVDDFAILYTDYTDEHKEKKAEVNKKINKERDPILFGVFVPKTDAEQKVIGVHQHLIFIGDWVDEFCDITLDKLIADFDKQGYTDFVKEIDTERNLQEGLEASLPPKPKKQSFLDKIKSFLK